MSYIHPQDLDEIHGDGFRNEYQRAHFVSSVRSPRIDERAKAQRIADNLGVFVVLAQITHYCRITDGLLGASFEIKQVLLSAFDAHAYVLSLDDGTDEDYQLFVLPPSNR